MGKFKKQFKSLTCFVVALSMVVTMALPKQIGAKAATTKKAVNATISYNFQGNDAKTAGFAQGPITVKSKTGGNYYLYWANNTGALTGY